MSIYEARTNYLPAPEVKMYGISRLNHCRRRRYTHQINFPLHGTFSNRDPLRLISIKNVAQRKQAFVKFLGICSLLAANFVKKLPLKFNNHSHGFKMSLKCKKHVFDSRIEKRFKTKQLHEIFNSLAFIILG